MPLQVVGRSGICIAGNTAKAESPFAAAAKEEIPELRQWTHPERGPKAELDSLIFQAGRFERVPEPPGYEAARLRALAQEAGFCTKYPTTKAPNLDNNEEVWACVLEAMSNVKPQSSPGVPAVALKPSNSQLLAVHHVLVANAAFQRIQLLKKGLPATYTALSLVQDGYCDPVRFFVKQEPHNAEKVKSRRFRLICSVSLTDQIVERVLSSRQNNAEIAEWETCPSCPGLGLSDDIQTDTVWRKVAVPNGSLDLAASDLTGYDWSVQDFELTGDAKCRVELAGAQGTSYETALHARVKCLALSVFALSDGTLIAQLEPGIQLSGSYNTSSTNSRMRVIAAFFVGASWAIAMGDDAVEEAVRDALEKYLLLGKKVKDYTQVPRSGEFSFCSHDFTGGSVAKPLNWSRSLYRLVHQETSKPEHLAEFCYGLRHDQDTLVRCVSTLIRIGWCTINDVNEGFQYLQQAEQQASVFLQTGEDVQEN